MAAGLALARFSRRKTRREKTVVRFGVVCRCARKDGEKHAALDSLSLRAGFKIVDARMKHACCSIFIYVRFAH